MKLKIDHALKILEKYGDDDVPLILLSDVRVPGSGAHLTQGMRFDREQYNALKGTPVSEIDVIYSEKLFAKLIANFPAVYRNPVGRRNVVEMDRLVDSLEASNYISKRKRCVVSLTEVYKKNPSGMHETVIPFGEKLHQKRWNEVKFAMGRNTLLDYRFDEGGIIVFFILSGSDPQYAQKFMRFTELISLIVESRNFGVTFSPDFNPETDIHSVNDKNALLDTYVATKATLIVVGEDINEDYKAALNQIKSYDRYARMMMVKNVGHEQRRETLEQVKKFYGLTLWEE